MGRNDNLDTRIKNFRDNSMPPEATAFESEYISGVFTDRMKESGKTMLREFVTPSGNSYMVDEQLMRSNTPQGLTALKSLQNESVLTDRIKGLFASMETSGDIHGDYLQIEPKTFEDLKRRYKTLKNIKYDDLEDPQKYDLMSKVYVHDLLTSFKMPSLEDAALWSWRPGWYEKYKGDIENIPDDQLVKIDGKMVKASNVMKNRKKHLDAFLNPKKESDNNG